MDISDQNGNMYHRYVGRILTIGHWANYGRSNIDKAYFSRYGVNIFHYTGTTGFYHASLDYKGPRLDIQIKFTDCPFFDQFNDTIEINVYSEVMDILKYKRMSPKLYNSFNAQIGKNIDVYVRDKENIWVDVKSLFNLNYGYK